MAALAEPAFTSSGPILDWITKALARTKMIVPAGEFGPGLPDRDLLTQLLTREVIAMDYAGRDRVWSGIAARARTPATGTAYQLIAIQVAQPGLLRYRNRLRPRTPAEKTDIDADLVYGLLRRLDTIKPGTKNIGGKLISSATDCARGRWRAHLARPIPAEPRDDDTAVSDTDVSDADVSEDPGTLEAVYGRWIASLAATKRPLDPADADLIAATRIRGERPADIAARLGVPVGALYKRRERAEARLRAVIPGSRGRTNAPPTPGA